MATVGFLQRNWDIIGALFGKGVAMKFIAIFCIVIGLVACTGTNSPTPIPSDAEVKIEVTTTSTIAIPSPTTTQLPTIPPTATQTSGPTSTNQPTLTPTSTATLSTLPDWFSEPTANILILGNKGNPRVTIFNAETGDFQVVNEYPVRKAIEEGFDNEPNTDEDSLSPNGRYQVKIVNDNRVSSVRVFDKETNLTTELLNPFLNHMTLDAEFTELATPYWSSDGEFLAVIYEKFYDGDSYQFDSNLAIYKASGEIFEQYKNTAPIWKNPWSPDTSYRILYTEGWRTPCILDIIKNKTTCLEVIHDWAISENVSPFNYIWSPDASQISFVYNNNDGLTGLCYIELITNDIKCPVTPGDLYFDEQFYARVHYWSPDGNYLALFFDEFGAGSDVFGTRHKVSVVGVGDNKIQLLEGKYRPLLGDPWRPPSSIQTD